MISPSQDRAQPASDTNILMLTNVPSYMQRVCETPHACTHLHEVYKPNRRKSA